MTIHIFFMFPETAGKSLEEVEEMFLSNVKAWETKVQSKDARKVETTEPDTEKQLTSGSKDSGTQTESKDFGATMEA